MAALDSEILALEAIIADARQGLCDLEDRGEDVRASLQRAERELFQLETHRQEWKSEIAAIRRRATEREEEEEALQRWRVLDKDRT